MSKRLFTTLGIAASLCVAALPIVAANAEGDEGTATTHVRIAVSTSIACSSSDGDIDNPTNIVDMGEIAPGTTTTGPTEFFVTGTTNALTGFTITGTPSDLVHETLSSEKFTYRHDDGDYDYANWWVTTAESEGVEFTDDNKIILSSDGTTADFALGANASAMGDTPAGNYAGTISWVCAIQ